MTLGDRLKKIRGDIPRSIFARRLGIHISSIRRYESENQIPKGDILEKIQEEFGVNTAWLLSGQGEPYIKDRRNGDLADKNGLWGKTERTEVDGREFTVTTFAPKGETTAAPVLGQAVDMLATVLGSGDQVFIQALMSNLLAFSAAVNEKKHQAARISALESECEDLQKRLIDVERTLRDLNEVKSKGCAVM